MIEHAQMLLAAHAALRRDVRLLRAWLAQLQEGSRAVSGVPQIDALALKRHAWHASAFCSRYCATVHVHHRIEDTDLFVALEAHQPSLRPTIKELVAEHVELSRLLDELEAAVQRLPGDHAAVADAARAAERVAGHREAHLDREERALLPALASLPAPR